MKKNTHIQVKRIDVYWNYLATLLQIGSGVLLFPFVLRILPSSAVGLWSVFLSMSTFVNLLDFGFSNSFSRNISYLFSGVDTLQKKGIAASVNADGEINYQLLAESINAMKWFYKLIAIVSIVLLGTIGTSYMAHVCRIQHLDFWGENSVAWILFCATTAYNIYTLYYDSLLQGRGLIKKDKQIIILSQLIYFFSTITLLAIHPGILSLVVTQGIAVVVRRALYRNVFYDKQLKTGLATIQQTDFKKVLRIMLPNASKVGITSVGAFLVLQSSIIIGSLYIPITLLASYNISVQLINVIASLAIVYYSTQVPLLAALRVNTDYHSLKKIYSRAVVILILTFVAGGTLMVFCGNILLQLVGAKTLFLQPQMLIAILLITLLEKNHAIAGGFLLSKNEVPYYKAAIVSGIATVLALLATIRIFNWQLWGMILAPGIVQLAYQNWRWPYVLLCELNNGIKKNNKQQ